MDRQQKIDRIYEVIATENHAPFGGPFNRVMIGDVLDWMDKVPSQGDIHHKFATGYCSCLAYSCGCHKSDMVWMDKRKPIEDQSDGCIQFVYSLIEQSGS